MNRIKLFGKLLNYPECCIKQFETELGFGRKSHNGFIPCDGHVDADATELIGHDPTDTPDEFIDYMLGKKITFKAGYKIYSECGKGDFFKKCWKESQTRQSGSRSSSRRLPR